MKQLYLEKKYEVLREKIFDRKQPLSQVWLKTPYCDVHWPPRTTECVIGIVEDMDFPTPLRSSFFAKHKVLDYLNGK